jgi:DNA modification methylase
LYIQNKIFLMDNLKLLNEIDDNTIDFIYSDILYGTGKNFEEYKDIKPNKKIVSDFYYERIKEMYRVLKNTGSIVLQMDKKINHWLRIILDEIFNYKNFRNEITWCYSGGGVSKNKFPHKSDVLIWYSKSNIYTFNPQYIPYTGIQKAHPYSKNREEKSKRGKHLEDWWTDINSFGGSTNHPEKKKYRYSNQKPELLMKRILSSWTNENDLVADFFMGSGSFISCAKEMKRRYLGCDISEIAFNITNKRLNKTKDYSDILFQKN